MAIAKLLQSLFPKKAPPTKRAAHSAQRQWISNPWHADSIVPGSRACSAARNSVGVRFLSKDAPVLPLTGCNARTCHCGYRHYQDRRGSPRRTADVIAAAVPWAGQERRRSQGRRISD